MTTYTEQDYRHMAKAGALDIDFEFTLPVRAACDDDLRLSGWNPDTNKADCFELMVGCGMGMDILTTGDLLIWAKTPQGFFQIHDKDYSHSTDKLAATMKAMCDCAIQIGRKMEESE